MGNSQESEGRSTGSVERRKWNQRGGHGWLQGLWLRMVIGVVTDRTLRVTDSSALLLLESDRGPTARAYVGGG